MLIEIPAWLRRFGLLCAALLVLTSCSTGDRERGDEPEIRPVDEILAGPIEIVDLTATGATLRVETTIDVVCSVVFGEDESYGRQSTDTDMAGGGHSVHHALMRNLEPGTVYHYRLVGAGPDGALYRGADMTFETPAADTAAASPGGRNVASSAEGARIAEVSSEFGPSWTAASAIDGDPATEWSSAGDGDDAFITVALAEPTELRAVGIWTRTMGSSAQIEAFQVVTEAGEVLGPFEVPDADGLHTFPVAVTAETLRFEIVRSSGGNTGLVELAAFAAD